MNIIIKFKGKTTFNEAYEIMLKTFEDAVEAAIVNSNKKDLEEIKLKAKSIVARVENRLFQVAHPELSKKEKWEEPLDFSLKGVFLEGLPGSSFEKSKEEK